MMNGLADWMSAFSSTERHSKPRSEFPMRVGTNNGGTSGDQLRIARPPEKNLKCANRVFPICVKGVPAVAQSVAFSQKALPTQ
jgi:hypothetical protein